MNKVFIFILTVILIPTFSSAQLSNVIFIGSVSVAGGGNYPYKLLVTDSNDVLSGYSVTDVTGPNETKTRVRGYVNRVNKQVHFRETKIIYTHSKDPEDVFCFIHASLKLTQVQGAKVLKGNFRGYKADGKTECGKGKIMLVCADDALDKLMEIAEKKSLKRDADTVTTVEEKVAAFIESPHANEKMIQLLPGKTLEIAVTSDTVTLDIWDAKDVDGDIITLLQGDKALLYKHTISGHHKKLKLSMDGAKKLYLSLVAEDEGQYPMNTARIDISTQHEAYSIDASTTLGKDVELVIKRTTKR